MVLFENMWGLYAFSALIPLIIVYLIKPKPIEKIIPSLMFIIREKKLTKKQSFLRKFVHNLLFYIQFLALCGLALAIASPFIVIPFTTSSENMVIVIDGSASMQTAYGAGTRFDAALTKAKENLDGKISIILAESSPTALVTKGTKEDALSVLGELKPKSTTSNVGDALLMANDLLGTETGNVIVLSDFISTEGADIMVAKKRIETNGRSVEFVDLSSDADNVGIIDLAISRATTKVKVKNYNKKTIETNLNIYKDNEKIQGLPLTIEEGSIEEVSFNTPEGNTKIELERKDDFMVDNSAYLSNPFKEKTKVLLVTNLKENDYVEAAIKASPDFSLEKRSPPTVNPEKLDHDVVIINEIDPTLLVPGDFDLISRYAKNGGSVVIMAQNSLPSIDVSDLLPFSFGSKQKSTSICTAAINRFTKQLSDCFTKSPYFDVPQRNGTSVLAKTDSGLPVLILQEHGSGKVVYYGIFDRESDFKSTAEYPIFWSELVGFLSGNEDIANYNIKTGDLIPIAEQTISTPSRSTKGSQLYADETGFYSYSGKVVASNLLSEKESTVNAINLLKSGKQNPNGSKEEQQKRKVNLDLIILGIISLLLFLELLIVKYRGDA